MRKVVCTNLIEEIGRKMVTLVQLQVKCLFRVKKKKIADLFIVKRWW